MRLPRPSDAWELSGDPPLRAEALSTKLLRGRCGTGDKDRGGRSGTGDEERDGRGGTGDVVSNVEGYGVEGYGVEGNSKGNGVDGNSVEGSGVEGYSYDAGGLSVDLL